MADELSKYLGAALRKYRLWYNDAAKRVIAQNIDDQHLKPMGKAGYDLKAVAAEFKRIVNARARDFAGDYQEEISEKGYTSGALVAYQSFVGEIFHDIKNKLKP